VRPRDGQAKTRTIDQYKLSVRGGPQPDQGGDKYPTPTTEGGGHNEEKKKDRGEERTHHLKGVG